MVLGLRDCVSTNKLNGAKECSQELTQAVCVAALPE